MVAMWLLSFNSLIKFYFKLQRSVSSKEEIITGNSLCKGKRSEKFEKSIQTRNFRYPLLIYDCKIAITLNAETDDNVFSILCNLTINFGGYERDESQVYSHHAS